jgi:hypothetical protein
MSQKRKLHHQLVRLRRLKAVYLVIGIVFFLGIGLYSLRQNNLTALRLRDKVLQVDEQNGDVEAALKDLRRYIYSHMNTDLASGPSAIKPPIQLKYRYERLLAAEKDRVSKQNEKMYTEAQAECEKRFPKGLSGSGRIPCIQDYVTKHGIAEQPIQDALYKFDFASPFWSPDIAGISLLIAAILTVLLITRLVLDRWLRNQMNDHL